MTITSLQHSSTPHRVDFNVSCGRARSGADGNGDGDVDTNANGKQKHNKNAPGEGRRMLRTTSPPPPCLNPADSPSISQSFRSRREALGLSPPSSIRTGVTLSEGEQSEVLPTLEVSMSMTPSESSTAPTTMAMATSFDPQLSPKHRDGLLFSPHLRKNLMREQKERDPLFYYEVTQTLGVGSMGSVAKVRKRKTAVGGSARRNVQLAVKKQKNKRQCLQIPFIGGLFRLCIDDKLNHCDLHPEDDVDPYTDQRRQSIFLPLVPGLRPAGKPLLEQTHGRTSSTFQVGVAEAAVTSGAHSSGSGSSNAHDIGLDLEKTSSSVVRNRSGTMDSMNTLNHDSSGRSSGTAHSSNSSQNGSSSYHQGHHGFSNIEYAMKSIHLSRVTDDTFVQELKNEIAILRDLDHPNIVRPMETFLYRNQIFIVMELCSGGDLYSRDPYTEEEAARIVSQILSAIAYMHSRHIAHRDLKYENILFVNDSPKSPVKLIDFGLSQTYGDNSQLTEGVGTIYTMAPEVLKGKYTQKADIWSIGVITYMLLSSQMPFYGRKRRHIVEQILNCQYDFRGRRWKRISKQAKIFIEELLVLDPEDRLDASSAQSCTWLNKRFAATMRAPDDEEETLARHAMLRYAGYTKLKKMALMIVAHKSTYDEIGILRKVFQRYDSFKDGCISFTEFSLALEQSGLSTEDLRSMFEAVDLNGSGRIKYTEFLAATIEAQGAISEERLAEAFDRLDSDDSGFISAENLAEILGEDFPRSEIDAILREVGTSNGRVSYSDFLQLWEQRHEEERHEALKLLGEPTHPSSESMMIESRSNLSLADNESVVSADEKEAAEARASFLLEKHIHPAPQVAFNETIIAIDANDNTKQQVLDDEPIDHIE